MRYEHWISHRYLTSSKGRFLSFLNAVSIGGVAIGVAALIVVLAVMEGFGNNLREKIIGTTPHIMVEKETGVKDYQAIQKQLLTIKNVEGVSPYVLGNVFLESHSQALGLILRGIDPNNENSVTKVNKYLVKGSLADLKENNVIIGSELVRYFGLNVGDTLTIISPGSGIAGQTWRYQLKIVGVFNTGMVDYDMNLIVTSLEQAQKIFNMSSNVTTGIGIRTHNVYDVKRIQKVIYHMLGYSFLVKTWIDINHNLFEALFLEKWGLFIILTLMVLVASFNIISTLIVTVTSKVHDIGILQSLGVPKKSIRRIFTNQGISIGIIGIFWGVVAGIALCWFLRTYVEVPREIYSIDHVPVELKVFDILVIIVSAFLISFLATIYPSAKAANLQPVDALRYE